MEGIRSKLRDEQFVGRHRKRAQAFTRRRCLTFEKLVLLLLQKTLKAIQLHLNEWCTRLALKVDGPPVSASAWTQARAKLRYTAFVELNETLLGWAYAVGSPLGSRRWRGHRLLALDSSLLRLPAEAEVAEEFGWVACRNQQGALADRCVQGRLSVLYDVLNGLALDAQLRPRREGERAVGMGQLGATQEGDVLVIDRGYAGYEWFARVVEQKRDFICRCGRGTFGAVEELFVRDKAPESVEVVLHPSNGQVGSIRALGLPEALTVRLISVRLGSGELEVLATSLRDKQTYPTECFAQAYGCRWAEETFYGLLKGRLDLEHFSGQSVESVLQDVHATVLLSNLESIVTRSAQARLSSAQEAGGQAKQVNRAVSFHAIKQEIFELLDSQLPVEQVLARLETLFLSNPVVVRRERKRPRRKPSAWRSYHYQRTGRKIVF